MTVPLDAVEGSAFSERLSKGLAKAVARAAITTKALRCIFRGEKEQNERLRVLYLPKRRCHVE